MIESLAFFNVDNILVQYYQRMTVYVSWRPANQRVVSDINISLFVKTGKVYESGVATFLEFW